MCLLLSIAGNALVLRLRVGSSHPGARASRILLRASNHPTMRAGRHRRAAGTPTGGGGSGTLLDPAAAFMIRRAPGHGSAANDFDNAPPPRKDGWLGLERRCGLGMGAAFRVRRPVASGWALLDCLSLPAWT
jgi:hypothetical protein